MTTIVIVCLAAGIIASLAQIFIFVRAKAKRDKSKDYYPGDQQ